MNSKTKIKKTSLKFGCLNIEGNAKTKCTTADVKDKVNNHDIFVIVESWLDPADFIPEIKGYVHFRSDRKKKRRAKRCSVGIIINCKNHIAKGVTKLNSVSNDALWLKLCKNHFGLEKDIFICTAYIPLGN